jgi:hypothetical protein
MSIKIMTAVWEHSSQSGNSLLLLLALADFANDGGICWPSVETLATKARVSDRTVQRMIQKLIAEGELEIVEKGGGRRSHRYRVLVRGDNLTPPEDVDNSTPISANDTAGVTQLRHPTPDKAMSPEPSFNTLEEPSEEEYPFSLVVKEWEKSVGPITGGIAEELGLMVDECEEHRRKLPDGAAGNDYDGAGWVVEAIQTANKSATGKFNVRYVQAILDRWIRDGFDSPFKREAADAYTTGVGKDFWG